MYIYIYTYIHTHIHVGGGSSGGGPRSELQSVFKLPNRTNGARVSGILTFGVHDEINVSHDSRI